MEAYSSTAGDDRSPILDLSSTRVNAHPRACNEVGVKLFGVRLTPDSRKVMMMRKAVSMGNLSYYNTTASLHAAIHSSTPERSESGEGLCPTDPHGYVSDGLVQNSGSIRERKKGVPWTEDEHRMFLVGLEKLGKGDWRGIARNFVPSRTPTQVASHAQKYFLRQNNLNKRKRRSSLFDMISLNPVSTTSNTSDHARNLATEMNLASSTSVSADLCLGISTEGQYREQQHSQVQRWCHTFSSQHTIVGGPTNNIPERNRLTPLTLRVSSQSNSTESNVVRPSAAMASFISSSAMSSSSSSSLLSSLCKIEEARELSASLTLGIAQPLLIEPSAELTLKLAQPISTSHSAIGGSTYNNSAFTTIQVV